MRKGMEQAQEDPSFNLNIDRLEPQAGGGDPVGVNLSALIWEPGVELLNADLGHQDMVMDSVDIEATP